MTRFVKTSLFFECIGRLKSYHYLLMHWN